MTWSTVFNAFSVMKYIASFELKNVLPARRCHIHVLLSKRLMRTTCVWALALQTICSETGCFIRYELYLTERWSFFYRLISMHTYINTLDQWTSFAARAQDVWFPSAFEYFDFSTFLNLYCNNNYLSANVQFLWINLDTRTSKLIHKRYFLLNLLHGLIYNSVITK